MPVIRVTMMLDVRYQSVSVGGITTPAMLVIVAKGYGRREWNEGNLSDVVYPGKM